MFASKICSLRNVYVLHQDTLSKRASRRLHIDNMWVLRVPSGKAEATCGNTLCNRLTSVDGKKSTKVLV